MMKRDLDAVRIGIGAVDEEGKKIHIFISPRIEMTINDEWKTTQSNTRTDGIF